MNCASNYSWKSKSLEMTHGNRLTFSPNTKILWSWLPYTSTNFPLYSQQQKKDLKALLMWCFSCTSDAAPVTQPGTIRIRKTEPFHVFMTFLIVLPTLSLHIEMDTYCTPYTKNWTCQIAYTGIKICYKIDKFAVEENENKVARRTVLT